jgi:hypothetical protein
VGAGGDRARDRLSVDVAEIRHRETVGREQRGNAMQARAGEQAHTLPLAVDRDEPGQLGDRAESRGDRDAGEAVARPDGLDRPAALRGGADRTPHRLDRRGVLDREGRTRSVRAQFCHVPRGVEPSQEALPFAAVGRGLTDEVSPLVRW